MQGKVVWFTGLSGAGKTTIAKRAATILKAEDWKVLILDGDDVRAKLHRHLGFSPGDIQENNRLVVTLCQDSLPAHDFILVPIISPFLGSRASARDILGAAFAEVYVYASLDEVIRRDPKGLYQQVQEGKLSDLIGTPRGVPYEPPDSPELVLNTETSDAETCANQLVDFLVKGTNLGQQLS